MTAALANSKSCFCPTDQCCTSNSASRPPFSCTRFHRPTFLNAYSILSSEAEHCGSRLKRNVPGRSNGSWGMTLMVLRSSERGTFVISVPETVIFPVRRSSMRKMAMMKDVFPAPEPPQTATFSPGLIFKERFLRIVVDEVLIQKKISTLKDNSRGMWHTCTLHWYSQIQPPHLEANQPLTRLEGPFPSLPLEAYLPRKSVYE